MELILKGTIFIHFDNALDLFNRNHYSLITQFETIFYTQSHLQLIKKSWMHVKSQMQQNLLIDFLLILMTKLKKKWCICLTIT